MLSKVILQAHIDKVETYFDRADKVVIVTHVSPDGDALGSSLGLYHFLSVHGKTVNVIVPNAFPDFLRWMPGAKDIIRYDKYAEFADKLIAEADVICCLDFNALSRIDRMADAVRDAQGRKVMIDHHLNPDMDTVMCISHPEACSTCELVFRLIWQLGCFENVTKKCAVPLYCGMMTDTGGFTYNSTRPEIFFIISQLLTKHINKDKIYRNVYNNYSEWRMRLTGYVLYQKMVVMAEHNACYFVLTREDLRRFHYIKGDAEGLVNMPLQIKGTKLSISLREDTEHDNIVWVSLRSVDDFPCNLMAEQYFNGGGHLNASGGRLECSIEEAEAIVCRAIEEFCKGR